MEIDVQKVRTRLEAKQTELQHEIAALLDEEASLEKSSLGVEDMGETAQDFQDVRQDESILLNQRHLLAAIEEALILNRVLNGNIEMRKSSQGTQALDIISKVIQSLTQNVKQRFE